MVRGSVETGVSRQYEGDVRRGPPPQQPSDEKRGPASLPIPLSPRQPSSGRRRSDAAARAAGAVRFGNDRARAGSTGTMHDRRPAQAGSLPPSRPAAIGSASRLPVDASSGTHRHGRAARIAGGGRHRRDHANARPATPLPVRCPPPLALRIGLPHRTGRERDRLNQSDHNPLRSLAISRYYRFRPQQDAVTRAESHQAKSGVGHLWNTWKTGTVRKLNAMLFRVHATGIRLMTFRVHHEFSRENRSCVN